MSKHINGLVRHYLGRAAYHRVEYIRATWGGYDAMQLRAIHRENRSTGRIRSGICLTLLLEIA